MCLLLLLTPQRNMLREISGTPLILFLTYICHRKYMFKSLSTKKHFYLSPRTNIKLTMHKQKPGFMFPFLPPLILSSLLVAAATTGSRPPPQQQSGTTTIVPTSPQQQQQASSLDSVPQNGNINNVFLNLHNAARHHANLPPYVWDVKLEQYAKNYLMKRANSDCDLIHSNGPYGENLFWGGGPQWTPKDAVKTWIKEHRFYDQKSNSCKDGKICGHFTQIVWRDSTKLGCAFGLCKTNDTFAICSYDPPGNYLGERPYYHYDH